MNLNKQTLVAALLALAAIPMTGQTDKTEEINRIKLDSDYLYAETTMQNEAEALSGAQALLEMTVIDWMSGQGQGEDAEAYIVQAKQHFTPIKTMRGQYHRAFLYVKKSDIVPIASKKNAMIIDAKDVKAATPQEADIQPQATEEVPAVVAEESNSATLTPEEQQLAAITQFSDVEGHITALENAGRVTGYGKKKTMPTEGVCHLLVYNREGSIVAVLRREADGGLLNLRTLTDDNVKNYPDCGAIWLQFKK